MQRGEGVRLGADISLLNGSELVSAHARDPPRRMIRGDDDPARGLAERAGSKVLSRLVRGSHCCNLTGLRLRFEYRTPAYGTLRYFPSESC